MVLMVLLMVVSVVLVLVVVVLFVLVAVLVAMGATVYNDSLRNKTFDEIEKRRRSQTRFCFLDQVLKYFFQ